MWKSYLHWGNFETSEIFKVNTTGCCGYLENYFFLKQLKKLKKVLAF